MRVVTEFPHEVMEEENIWIPLSDGIRLAARLWRPVGSEGKPVPAILEYLPYRKRDGTAPRDQMNHPYFAGHGYAAVRVDMRGSGESDGLMWDEYLKQEQDDALEVIDWLTRQEWCDGSVGMIGISWGGFNGLQVAMRKPKALKAIVTICSTVDRYADDIHYKGGCMLLENIGWSAQMQSYSSRPPDPALVGDAWKNIWLDRLKNQPCHAETWFDHQQRDDYWKHGSVCEDWSAIDCAVLAVGGWGDGYKNAVGALVANLTCPVKGIVGPWIHKYPNMATPGPRIGFLQECLKWWDHWLKGIDRGVEDWPDYRAYSQTGSKPAVRYDHRPGEWIAEQVWPSPNISERTWYLTPRGLAGAAEPAETLYHRSPQDVGNAAGEYFAWSGDDLPPDQREDDGKSLVFETLPLTEDVEIFGTPKLILTLSVDQPQANLALRLNDVLPDGAVQRVSFGTQNLSQRDDREAPTPMPVGEATTVTLSLDDVAHRFLKGHRIRVAISTAYWPMIWPSPQSVGLSLVTGVSRLLLPVRSAGPGQPSVAFEAAEIAPPLELKTIRAGTTKRETRHDLARGIAHTSILVDEGEVENTDIDLTTGASVAEEFSVQIDAPCQASYRSHWTQTLRRTGWSVRTESTCAVLCDETTFHLSGRVEAFEDDQCVHVKTWSRSIQRRFV